MGFSSVRAPGITGDIQRGSGIAGTWDVVGAGIMTAGGTMDTTPVAIVAAGDMTAMPEAMRMRAIAELMRAADIAVEQDSAVEKASMVEVDTTVEVASMAADSMEVDAVKR